MMDDFFRELILQRQKVIDKFKNDIVGKKLILVGEGILATQTKKMLDGIEPLYQMAYCTETARFFSCNHEDENCLDEFNDLLKIHSGSIVVLIAQEKFSTIKKLLEEIFALDRKVIYISLANWSIDLDEHEQEIKEIFSLLNDEFSKITLRKILLARVKRCIIYPSIYTKMNVLCNHFIYKEELVSGLDEEQLEEFRELPQTYFQIKTTDVLPLSDQYFRSGIFTFSRQEVYVDAGAFDGDTIRQFITVVDDHYKCIYAFEPDSINFEKMQTNLGSLTAEKIKFICAGLSDRKNEMPFSSGKFIGSHFEENSNCFVKTGLLDDYVKEQVSFIKMDIEGYEFSAILGAKRILSEDQPKLAICLYHKPEDIWEIPLLINKINKRYKLYIRQHSIFGYETILYAKV